MDLTGYGLQVAELDGMDWRLLAELQADGRLSYNELSRRLHLSAPAIAERVRKLEQAGVITGYRAIVDAAATGAPLVAFIQLRCAVGHCLLRTTAEGDFPEIAEIHKLSGEFCTMLKVRAADLAHLEGVIDAIGRRGELRTHIVMSTPFERSTVEPSRVDRHVEVSEGWS
jgi:Lrp/AsnC family leucine-responsive transcriptional regulator